jgi:prepilin-type N-terminal cleavage/methylation domain-containing protein/prepilin-type processing-associated H-X9-DG protein
LQSGTSHPAAGPRSGFTLVELLVVVAVTGVLIALLLPTISRARESARRTGCASNLRQLGMAVQAYLDDHDGLYPVLPLTAPPESEGEESDRNEGGSPSDWEEVIQPYLHSEPILRCPSDPSPVEFFDISYSLNASFVLALHESAVTYPAETILAADRRNSFFNQGTPALFLWWEWQPHVWPPSARPDPAPAAAQDLALDRHGDCPNLLFVDGHVRHLLFQTTWGAGRTNQYWPQRP